MDFPVNAAAYFRAEQFKLGNEQEPLQYLLLTLAGLVDPDAQIPTADHAERIMKMAGHMAMHEKTIAARASVVDMVNSYKIRPLPE